MSQGEQQPAQRARQTEVAPATPVNPSPVYVNLNAVHLFASIDA